MDGCCRYCGKFVKGPARGPQYRTCKRTPCRKRYAIAIVNFTRRHNKQPQIHCKYCGLASKTWGNKQSKLCWSTDCKRRYQNAYHRFFRFEGFQPDISKTCIICNSQFTVQACRVNQLTCSRKCRNKLAWQRDKRIIEKSEYQLERKRRNNRDWLRRNPNYHKKYGPKPSKRKPLIEHVCRQCGGNFLGRQNRIYCGRACSKIAARVRQLEMRPMRICICGAPLKRKRKWCDACRPGRYKITALRGRHRRREKETVAMQAAFELGLIPFAKMRRDNRDIILKALRELNII